MNLRENYLMTTGWLIGFLIGMAIAGVAAMVTERETQRSAIKAGVATWVSDEDGKAKFQWKTAKDNKP